MGGLLYSARRALLGGNVIRYLLRDDFDDTRAAGAVNGTAATPGPGTRVAIENDGQFTIGSGLFTFPYQVSPVYNDQNLNYESFTRTAGRMLLASVTPVVANKNFIWGWSLTGTPLLSGGGFWFLATGVIQMRWAGNGIPVVPVYTATNCKLAAILRTVGSFLFIKGDAFATWTLLWAEASRTDNPVTPTLINYTSSGVFDFIRIPDALWLPTPLAYDTFTRANGALGSTEALGPDSQPTPQRTWVDTVGTTLVATNKAQASALVGGLAIATVETSTADVLLRATLTQVGGNVGVVLRYQDADNYVYAYHDGTNCVLVKRVATVETTVITAVVAIGAGALVIICSGTSWSVYLNNAQVGTTQTIAQLTTGTQQGLYSTNVGNTQDAFLIFPRGTGSEYADLNRWSQ